MADIEQRQRYTVVGGGGKFADGSLSIADAVAVEEAILHQKESFCFCCCDYRRAVIIIDSILLVAVVLNLMTINVLAASLVNKGFDEGFAAVAVVLVLLTGIGLVASGIYGAAKYQRWGVIAGGVFHFVRTMQAFYGLIGIFIFPEQYQDAANLAYANMAANSGGSDLSESDAANVMMGSMIFTSIGIVIMSCFYLHAHVKLLRLMKQGVMTPQNYRNVSSCCCG